VLAFLKAAEQETGLAKERSTKALQHMWQSIFAHGVQYTTKVPRTVQPFVPKCA
jgi:hypothetical protein